MDTTTNIPSVGLHVLYEPGQDGTAVIDVVLVHGFGGHPMRSWQCEKPPPSTRKRTNTQVTTGPMKLLPRKTKSLESMHQSKSNPPFWPRHLLPQSCPEARIMTWGYRSLHSGNIPVPVQPDLFSHVNALLRDLVSLRQDTDAQKRPLIFLAHSLGGVLVKEALCQAHFSEMRHENAILRSTSAVVFFGCPHRTVEQEPVRDAVVAMAEETVVGVRTERTILSALCGVNNPRWDEAQRAFVQFWHHFNFVVKTYQETDNKSNTNEHAWLTELGNARENAETLSADHRTMCQFKSTSDAGFRSLEKVLQEIVRDEQAKHRGLTAGEKHCLERLIGDTDCNPQPARVSSPQMTCRQVCNTKEFSNWYRRQGGSNKRMLWLTGGSGSGKSTQLRHLWSRLKTQWQPTTASVIYCTAESQQSLDRAFMSASKAGSMRVATTIRSLLSQLFAQDLKLRRSLSLCERRIDDADLIRFFLDEYITSSIHTLRRRTFILVDAENTCDDTYIRDLLYCLNQMARNSDFSVCLASRPITVPRPVNLFEVELEHHNLEDIVSWVQTHLRATWEERAVIVRKVAEKARGSFLWAQVATNFLNGVIDSGGAQDLVDQVLGELPVDLFDLYEWIIGTLSSKEKAEATIIMRWVTLSAEPMTLNDLCRAVRLGRTHFLACSDPIAALDVGSPWSMQDLQRKGKHFDTPSRFYDWIRARTGGLLEARATDSESKAQKSLGLRYVHPIHPSIKSWFMSGKGFAALAAGRATTAPQNCEAVDYCHYSLLRTILMYLNTSDPLPLVRGQCPSLEIETSPRRPKDMDHDHVAISSYPFLRYAADNLLYHLLSPRPLRYFLPQQAIFSMFTSHDCRIWRRWTALLGKTEASAIMTRCKSAEELLRPEYGASFRLERVFRAVDRIATGDSWFSIPRNPKLSVPIPGMSKEIGESRKGLESCSNPPSLWQQRRPQAARSRGAVIATWKRQADNPYPLRSGIKSQERNKITEY